METQPRAYSQPQGVPVSLSDNQMEKQLPEISFIPSELIKKEAITSLGVREKCALVGVGLGALALISWVIILFGVVFATIGIVLSIFGLKSQYSKHAKIGITLSIVGLIASFWYIFAAYHGMVNYNYFTSDFWGGKSTSTQGVK